MKKIEAFIRPEKLEDIKEGLRTVPVGGMSITQVMGFGRQRGWKGSGTAPETEAEVNLLPKIKLEAFVPDEQEDEMVRLILEAAHTGEVGDGKVFVSEAVTAVRIRTREAGEVALG